MTEHVDFERYGPDALAARDGTKWGRDGGALLAAWIADMDFPVADPVRTALVDAIERDDLGYPSLSLIAEVEASFVADLNGRYGLAIDTDLVRLTTDVVQAISLAILTLSEPGDGVCFFTPAYPPYFGLATAADRHPVTVEMIREPDRYVVDLEALEAAFRTERPAVFLLCNPQNPTGHVLTEAELTRIAELCLEYDVAVLADEIHAALTYSGHRHLAIAAVVPDVAPRTVTMTSLSKAFNLAGLRCAFSAYGSAELVAGFDALPYRSKGEVSGLGLIAARAALADGTPWLEQTVAYLEANRNYLAERVGEIPTAVHLPPEATYLAWIDLTAAKLDDEPVAYLERTAKIALSPGLDFGPSGAGFCRLNFATPRPILTEILDRFVEALQI